MKQPTSLFEKVVGRGLQSRKPRIGFGLREPHPGILRSLHKAKRYAHITLVGPKSISAIKGFEKVISSEPESKLAELLSDKAVEGIVRGTIDDFKTFEAYSSRIGKAKARKLKELVLLEDAKGRQFFLSEASNPGSWSRADKKKNCQAVIDFMKTELNITPKIGFITGIRHESYQRKRKIKEGVQGVLNRTYEDAETLSRYFRGRKVYAKNYAIEIETAIQDGCNIIVPPNGMVGNQIFRTLTLIGGGRVLTASRIHLPDPYEDNSRSEVDFENHLKWLVAWINSKKLG